MRTRIEAFGDVQEPEIAISGENSVLVQLPGVTDQERAIEALGTTGLLTFRPVLDSSMSTGYSPALELIVDPDDPENVSTAIKEGLLVLMRLLAYLLRITQSLNLISYQ